mmetsp:Transcript_51976/g.123742  ORF Transcript_51976/g.123742 Transcript_51976/m.123742 type:complete len:210 (-) Transcript_51976:222-851(-)
MLGSSPLQQNLSEAALWGRRCQAAAASLPLLRRKRRHSIIHYPRILLESGSPASSSAHRSRQRIDFVVPTSHHFVIWIRLHSTLWMLLLLLLHRHLWRIWLTRQVDQLRSVTAAGTMTVIPLFHSLFFSCLHCEKGSLLGDERLLPLMVWQHEMTAIICWSGRVFLQRLVYVARIALPPYAGPIYRAVCDLQLGVAVFIHHDPYLHMPL